MATGTGPRNIGEIPLSHMVTVQVPGKTGAPVAVTSKSPIDPQLYQVLSDIREQVLQTRQRLAVPDPPTNFKATAQSLSILLQWTRSGDADYYEVLKAFTPSTSDPHLQVIDVGNSASYADNIGSAAIKTYYWVRARKVTGAASLTMGPQSATTVAPTTGVPQPTPPPASSILVVDTSTGRVIPYVLADPRSYRQ